MSVAADNLYSRSRTGIEALYWAALLQAFEDVTTGRNCTVSERPRVMEQARQWLTDPAYQTTGLTLELVCEVCDVDPEHIRRIARVKIADVIANPQPRGKGGRPKHTGGGSKLPNVSGTGVGSSARDRAELEFFSQ